jgi:hypothetical protein
MSATDIRRYTVEDIGRVYEHPQRDLWLPSVSTVLNVRPKPEALKNWLSRTDNADEINRYKRNRGTLVHYDILNELQRQSVPDSVPDHEADLWSEDEQGSVAELKSEGKWERCQRDREWVSETAWPMMQTVANIDYVIDVETFVIETSLGYAGQFDLLYYDAENDDVVLSDIKTGKHVYEKNMLQGEAYRHAVPIKVDRLEVLRVNPDFRDWELSSSEDWETTSDERWTEFCDLHSQLAVEEMVESIQDRHASGEAFVEGENESADAD